MEITGIKKTTKRRALTRPEKRPNPSFHSQQMVPDRSSPSRGPLRRAYGPPWTAPSRSEDGCL